MCVCVQEELSDYGVDWSGPTATSYENEIDRVIIPTVPALLNHSQFSYLQSSIDPLQQCDDYGKSLYVTTRQLVREMLSLPH